METWIKRKWYTSFAYDRKGTIETYTVLVHIYAYIEGIIIFESTKFGYCMIAVNIYITIFVSTIIIIFHLCTINVKNVNKLILLAFNKKKD